LEVGNAFLLEVVLHKLGLGTPAQLARFTVILSNLHFHSFYPACLFFHFADPPYGLPFMPFSRLYILHAAVERPTFTHLSSIDMTTVVRLPYDHRIVWTDFVQLLDFSGLLCVLIIDALHFDIIPASIVASPLILVHTLDLTFHAIHSMADVLAHVIFPVLHTLCLRFCVDDDLACAFRCASILISVTELVIFGHHPSPCLSADHTYDLFRFLYNVQLLDMRLADPGFWTSFRHASAHTVNPNDPNFNACPMLRHLYLSDVDLPDL
jgi:hypothetical protein